MVSFVLDRFPCELFFLLKGMDSHLGTNLEGGAREFFFFFEGRENKQKWHIFFDLFKSDIDKTKRLTWVTQIYPWYRQDNSDYKFLTNLAI